MRNKEKGRSLTPRQKARGKVQLQMLHCRLHKREEREKSTPKESYGRGAMQKKKERKREREREREEKNRKESIQRITLACA